MKPEKRDTTTTGSATKIGRAASHAPARQAPEAGGPPSGEIRVLCVDDHPVLVEGLRTQFDINGRIKVVGRLATAEGLVEKVKRLRPDAVLLDIEMPGPDAFETADRLKRAHPDVRIMILSAHVRDVFITASSRCGACAYFSKSDDLEDIESGIVRAMRSPPGSFLLGPKVLEHARTLGHSAAAGERSRGSREHGFAAPEDAPKPLVESLSPREIEVLRLIGKGLSRVEIARELSRSAKTIDAHQARLMRKLGITARADLMRFAIREGLAQA
ncbi:MAG TPA: response regulator transcription factor [Phycisphaerales bacterium]|nr:response regulator transcription factor [Phycisphaerales bacterium]